MPKNREQKGSEKNLFPILRIWKGMKKRIATVREEESETFIPKNEKKWEFLLLSDRLLVKDQKTNSDIFVVVPKIPGYCQFPTEIQIGGLLLVLHISLHLPLGRLCIENMKGCNMFCHNYWLLNLPLLPSGAVWPNG